MGMFAKLLLFMLCPRRASQLKSALHVERGIALTVSRLVSIKLGNAMVFVSEYITHYVACSTMCGDMFCWWSWSA